MRLRTKDLESEVKDKEKSGGSKAYEFLQIPVQTCL